MSQPISAYFDADVLLYSVDNNGKITFSIPPITKVFRSDENGVIGEYLFGCTPAVPCKTLPECEAIKNCKGPQCKKPCKQYQPDCSPSTSGCDCRVNHGLDGMSAVITFDITDKSAVPAVVYGKVVPYKEINEDLCVDCGNDFKFVVQMFKSCKPNTSCNPSSNYPICPTGTLDCTNSPVCPTDFSGKPNCAPMYDVRISLLQQNCCYESKKGCSCP